MSDGRRRLEPLRLDGNARAPATGPTAPTPSAEQRSPAVGGSQTAHAAQGTRRTSGMWIGGIVITVGAVGAAALMIVGQREPPRPSPPVAGTLRGASSATVSPASDVVRGVPQNVCERACCGDTGECNLPDGRVGCPSGRDCTATGCGELLEPGRRFRVRFGKVAFKPGAKVGTDLIACVARSASAAPRSAPRYECVDLNRVNRPQGAETNLVVSTEDLVRDGLSFYVGMEPTDRDSFQIDEIMTAALFGPSRHAGGVRRSTLCRGLRFPPSAQPLREGVVESVRIYLDDP